MANLTVCPSARQGFYFGPPSQTPVDGRSDPKKPTQQQQQQQHGNMTT